MSKLTESMKNGLALYGIGSMMNSSPAAAREIIKDFNAFMNEDRR